MVQDAEAQLALFLNESRPPLELSCSFLHMLRQRPRFEQCETKHTVLVEGRTVSRRAYGRAIVVSLRRRIHLGCAKDSGTSCPLAKL